MRSGHLYKNNKLIALIPARGGSKGLTRKNVRLLMGRPLIEWTVEAAKKSKYLDKIIVSTEDAEIADIARRCGAEVPFLRPARLAGDHSLVTDVALHVIDSLKRENGEDWRYMVLLQPTSPLRISGDIDSAIREFFSRRNTDAIVGVTEVSENPFWMQTIDGRGLLKSLLPPCKTMGRRQDLPKVYMVNGAIYVCKTNVLRKEGTFCPKKSGAYIMPKNRSVDIDDEEGFALVEKVMRKSISNGHR